LGEPLRAGFACTRVGLSAPAPFFGGGSLRAPPPKKWRVRYYPSRCVACCHYVINANNGLYFDFYTKTRKCAQCRDAMLRVFFYIPLKTKNLRTNAIYISQKIEKSTLAETRCIASLQKFFFLFNFNPLFALSRKYRADASESDGSGRAVARRGARPCASCAKGLERTARRPPEGRAARPKPYFNPILSASNRHWA
jgi:hypothetical protein